MADYDNRSRGTLFKNNKQGHDNWPDYKGSLDVDGVQYWISCWIKEAGPNTKRPGEKFMSLSVEPKEKQTAKPSHGVPDSAFGDETDVPF